MLGGIVIANYITVATDLETSNCLFAKLSQEVHNKTARIL